MNVSSLDPFSSTSQTSGIVAQRNDRSALGKDEFLRLLVTQLSNQDPLNPMDGQQFAAQLAQFTSVEQLINIGETLQGQGEMNGLLASSINSGVASGLIGKTVDAAGNAFSYDGEGKVTLGAETAGAANKIKVQVRDSQGTVVRTLEMGHHDAGRHTFSWDGKNDAGAMMPKGNYTFSVSATVGDEPVAAGPFVQGKVDRVTFGHDGIMLWVGGTAIPMGSVRSVEE